MDEEVIVKPSPSQPALFGSDVAADERAARGAPNSSGSVGRLRRPEWPRISGWTSLVGLAVLAAPTLYLIAQASWTDEQSQQGPIVLAIGAWLLWRRWPQMRQAGAPGSLVATLVGFTICALAYISGRVASLFILEAYALYGFGLCAIYSLVGLKGVLKGLFPIVFLAFAVPVPFFIGFPITVHLRLWITEATIQLLQALGVHAARDGLILFVESYRIEIAEACSGTNSLLALTALGLCYVHLRRNPLFLFYIAMLPLIVIFAVVANFVRVVCLALMTLNFGDAIAQGILHETLGFVTFAVALGLTLLADAGLGRLWPQKKRQSVVKT